METNSERRRRKLAALCAERGLDRVADRAGLTPASLDQIIKGTKLPPKKDGTRSLRNLGNDAARKIEDGEGFGRGWFDLEDGTEASTPDRGKPPSLSGAVRDLAGYLDAMDADARKKAAGLLAILTDSPKSHAHIAALLGDVIGAQRPVEQAAPSNEKNLPLTKQHDAAEKRHGPQGIDRRQQNRREG